LYICQQSLVIHIFPSSHHHSFFALSSSFLNFKMNSLKGYLKQAKKESPKKADGLKNIKVTPPIEMAFTPPLGSPISTAPRTPLSSRPSSLYPAGDFRNSPRESVLDIKADVMLSWLYQQQLERLWTEGAPNEGVVLKKSRGNFACCPDTLKNERDGFFDQVIAMNVKVRLHNIRP
jgi:hypothetical protein